MMANLRDDQFAGLAQEASTEDSGFTIKHTTGYRPSKGYAVALAGGEETVPTRWMSGGRIKAYAQKYGKSLGQRGVYLGAWTERRARPSGAQVLHTDLDNTRIVRSRKRALNEMVMQNQRAVYDLGAGESIYNPIRQEPTTFKEPVGFDREQYEKDVADLYRKAHGRQSLAAEVKSRRV